MKGKTEISLRAGEHVGEWLQVKDDRVAVTGSMRWFWQQFPVEWQGRADGLTLRLWSPRGGELDFSAAGIKQFFGEAGEKYLLDWKKADAIKGPIDRYFYTAGKAALDRGDADGLGINKHHEFYLHFARADQAKAGKEYGRLVAQPPLALASGAWNVASDVMGPIAARPNGSPAEAIVDRIFDLSRSAQVSRRVSSPNKAVKLDDLKTLQGKWLLVEANGQPLNPPGKWQIKDNRLIRTINLTGAPAGAAQEATLVYTLSVNSGASPKQIDWTMGEFGTMPGIYKLEGGKLIMCKAGFNEARPTRFEADKRTRAELLVFVRAD